jgi:hypothetical protein
MLTRVADDVLVHRSELMASLASDPSGLGRPVAAAFATHPDWDRPFG